MDMNELIRRKAGYPPPEEPAEDSEPEGSSAGSADGGARGELPPQPTSMNDWIREWHMERGGRG